MEDGVILSKRDAERLQRMLRAFEHNTDTRYQRRRHKNRGGGGGGKEFNVAYCAEDAPDRDEILCYLGADLLAWDIARTYITDEWVIVGGVEYKSLQDDNLNHIVTETSWWEEGTAPTITVKCLIANGTSLIRAGPFLKKGQDIPVEKIGDDWYCTNLFAGARLMSFGVEE